MTQNPKNDPAFVASRVPDDATQMRTIKASGHRYANIARAHDAAQTEAAA